MDPLIILSKCYNVYYTDKLGESTTLLLSVYKIKIADKSIVKLPNQKKGESLLDETWPKMDILILYCNCKSKCYCKFLNIPKKFPGKIHIYNNCSTNPAIINTEKDYETYINTPPRFLYMHKYFMQVPIMGYRQFFDQYHRYTKCYKFKLSCDKGRIVLHISDYSNNHPYGLSRRAVKDLVGVCSSVVYTTHAQERIGARLEELIQLLEPLELDVKLIYKK